MLTAATKTKSRAAGEQKKLRVKEVKTLADLTSDPANCRKHNPRNIGAIVNSLGKVGAARSIVIDEDGVILAGNGMAEACGEVGIENVKVVEADGNTIIAVRRTGLTPRQKAELAIGDNRTAELATWDADQLLKTIGEYEIDPLSVEFTQAELDALSKVEPDPEAGGPGDAATPGTERFMVVLTCRDEGHQRELLDRFEKEAIECRALIG